MTNLRKQCEKESRKIVSEFSETDSILTKGGINEAALEEKIADALEVYAKKAEELEISVKGVQQGGRNIQNAMQEKIDELTQRLEASELEIHRLRGFDPDVDVQELWQKELPYVFKSWWHVKQKLEAAEKELKFLREKLNES